jgi:O-antigen/teichoic acid export membrane protein
MARVSGGARGRATRSLLWTALESGAVLGSALAALVVFGWTLTPAELGIGALAFSIVQLMNLPVELLCYDGLIQRREVSPRHFNTAFTTSLLFGASLSALCWWAGDALAAAVGDPRAGPVLQWMSLILPATGAASALVAWHQREFRFRILAIRSLVGRLGAFAAALALALLGAGVWAFVAYQVLVVALAAAVLWLASSRRPRLGFGAAEFKELTGFGLRVVGARAADFAALPLFMLYVGAALGTEAAGLFSLAQRTVETLRSVVSDAFARLMYPMFARLQDSARLLRRAFGAATELICVVTFPIFAGLGAVAPHAVVLVFGERWQAAAPAMAGLCVLAMLIQTRLYSLHVVVAVGRPHDAMAVRVAELLVLAVAVVLGPSTLALAVSVWVGRVLLAAPLDLWLLRRAIRMPASAQLRPVVAPLLLSAAMAAGVVALDALIPAAVPRATRLVAEVAFGVAFYATGLVLLRHPLVRYARAALGTAARRVRPVAAGCAGG